MQPLRSFASDNNAGVHPRVFEAMARVNAGYAPAYGADRHSEMAAQALREAFGDKARPWFALLGTAANVLGLQCAVRSHEAVLCAENAHLQTDECGAPEAQLGCKLLLLPAPHGKIRTADCLRWLTLRDSVHHNCPRALSVTQSTECGTVYTLAELKEIGAFCRANDLVFHMDGTRLANAAAALGVSLRELSADVGVDVLSFGGTKNGLMFGEAVIFFNDSIGAEFGYLRKQQMQLLSKMRFLAAQFLEYFTNDLWLENARTANRMAALLAGELRDMEHVRIVHPVEVNAVFARLHKNVIAKLREDFYFYTLDAFDAPGYPQDWHLVRLMTSFATTEDEVAAFVEALKACRDVA